MMLIIDGPVSAPPLTAGTLYEAMRDAYQRWARARFEEAIAYYTYGQRGAANGQS